jgi:hypothetical protein
MYTVDDQDRVEHLSDIPPCAVGAPLPVVLANDYRLLLAYLLADKAQGQIRSWVSIVDPDTEAKAIAVVTFDLPYAHLFGPPNDEAFEGHPLHARGLRPYDSFQIHGSSWIRALERMNRVHLSHHASLFERYRHFILAFHDSTFECVARGYSVSLTRGTLRHTLHGMVELL